MYILALAIQRLKLIQCTGSGGVVSIYCKFKEVTRKSYVINILYILNRSGPKIDPWGTPVVIAASFDLKSPTSTYCLQLYR